jgi:hypothetical protein
MSATLSHSERVDVARREIGGRVKLLPLVDGLPAEGGDSEDHHVDFEDAAWVIAIRMNRMAGRSTT